MINKNLLTLKDIDLYSLSMFALYKLSSIPEYSTISELPYIVDQENMLKLCQYFGGRTIRIPTLPELNSLMSLLLLYQYNKIENIPYDDAITLIGYKSTELRQVKIIYSRLCKILEKYDIKTRDQY